MQTGAKATRITTVAHSANAILPTADGQIICDDTRLRAWTLAASGGLTGAYPVACQLTGNGDMLRLRTLADDTLDARYATPGAMVTWSANTLTAAALAGTGVDVWVDGATVDAFWFDADGVTLKTARSSDNGHTWAAAVTVATLGAQGTGVLPQLCAPMADVVVFTDSTVGADADGNPLTALYVCVNVSGVWNTPKLWDLGGQALGVERAVTLPNGGTYPSNLSGAALDETRVALAFYASNFREGFQDGVWSGQCANLDFANATQHLHWNDPQVIFNSVAIDDDNGDTQMFAAFPRLQRVGSEYWIVALEASQQAGHERYHLGFFRSTDGVTWSDRDYNQGAAEGDETSGAYVYDNDGTPTQFAVTDLLYAGLVVSGTKCFIVSYDRVFWCEATTLVGVDNPARQLDLTSIVSQWAANLPAAPNAGTLNVTIQNVPKLWDERDVLTAHKGVRLLAKAGYRTPVPDGMGGFVDTDEMLDVGQFYVDQITQATALGQNNGTVQAQDGTMLLERWKSDVYWEWFGAQQTALDNFCDLTPFVVVNGAYTTTRGGALVSGTVRDTDSFRDDVAALNLDACDGGVLTARVRCDKTWTNNHAGVAFQGKLGDNKTFWAVLYNKRAGKFSLHSAIPRTNVNRVKLYKYRTSVAESSAVNLDADTWYWLRVGVWHGHVMAWYAADGVNWTNVIDYMSPAIPATAVIPSRTEWWGLIGTQRTQPSGALGQLSGANGGQDLSDGANHPRMVALHVQTGNEASVLRRVNVAITQENYNADPMPDVNVLLISGDASSPDDATDEDHVLFASNASALHFGSHYKPGWVGANARPNPANVRLDANQHVWIAVTFTSDLTAGQSYQWVSGALGGYTTKYSDDGGATWSSFGDATLQLTASIEVEYLAGRVKWRELYFGSAEKALTYESLAHRIAAKAGVLDLSPFDFVAQTDLILSGDGIYWQPQGFGKVGDVALETDVTVSSTARVCLGSSTTGSGDADGYTVEITPGTQNIAFYKLGVLLGTSESLAYLPEAFHLSVVNQDNFLYVYVNETLAAIQYDTDAGTPGYLGVDGTGATWSHLRVPDLHQIVEYFALEQGETALGGLQQLIAKPAPGTTARGKFFVRYDGSLRIGSFARRTVVDTYTDTLFRATKAENARYALSQIQPNGNYYATRFDGNTLDTDGRIYDRRDDTDARSDADAYAAAADVFRDANEKMQVGALDTLASWAAEREDCVRVVNPNDATDGDYVINDLTWTYSLSPVQANQKMGLRKKAGV